MGAMLASANGGRRAAQCRHTSDSWLTCGSVSRRKKSRLRRKQLLNRLLECAVRISVEPDAAEGGAAGAVDEVGRRDVEHAVLAKDERGVQQERIGERQPGE